ncbi:unnamed protein product [Orchesella dallaii]|uniref:Terpene synthase n=1 Tax=Orchesella dallaii TaxID=48710 RepID=A0ABP1PSE9_9HEXA
MEKFGQVYIRRKDGNSSDELELIPSARFSNLDHKWYDSDGNIHSEFEKHHGRDISLSFKTTQYDTNGVLVHFQGAFRAPCKLGDICNQDFEGVEAAGNEDIEIIRSFNLIPEKLFQSATRRFLELTALLAAIHAGSKLRDIEMHRICNIAIFLFDDDMEKLTDLKFDSFREFLNSTNMILKKNSETVEYSKETVPELLLNHLKWFQVFEKQLSIAEGGTERGKFVRESLMENIEVVCLETCVDWNEEKSILFKSAQEELRVAGSGSIFTLEMVLFEAKVEVKEEIRNTFIFKWFVNRIARHIALTNDLLSYRKEAEAGRANCNMVYLLHYHKGLPLQEAMQRVLDESNHLAAAIVETVRMITKLYQNDYNLERFVSKAEGVAYGSLQWYPLTERYHKGFHYDCILE